MSHDPELIKRIVEAALLAAGEPLTVQRLANLFDEAERPENSVIREALESIEADCEGRGYELRKIASGYRFQVRTEMGEWIGKLWEEKPQRYSRATLETLALIAYRQPITRGDIEEIRGVAVSSQIMKTLQERDWVRVVGHRDVPGRPELFATTKTFLDYFNLSRLEDLPPLADIRDLDSINGELELAVAGEAAAADAASDDAGADSEGAVDATSDTETQAEAGSENAAAVDEANAEPGVDAEDQAQPENRLEATDESEAVQPEQTGPAAEAEGQADEAASEVAEAPEPAADEDAADTEDLRAAATS